MCECVYVCGYVCARAGCGGCGGSGCTCVYVCVTEQRGSGCFGVEGSAVVLHLMLRTRWWVTPRVTREALRGAACIVYVRVSDARGGGKGGGKGRR